MRFFSFLSLAASTASATSAKETFNGVNLGGWFILEPWITPSMFFQFLDRNNTEDLFVLDQATFCEALGDEATHILGMHTETWIQSEDFEELKKKNVSWVRLPIGDWMLEPYGPYMNCYDEEWANTVDEAFDWANDNNIKILLEVHGLKGSQNGMASSGQASKVSWDPSGIKFHHLDQQEANWMGTWNSTTGQYDNIDFSNLQRSLRINEKILQRWGTKSSFFGFEPVNEPWANSDVDVLKDFYRKSRRMVQKYSPKATFVFHDAFHYEPSVWNDLFEDFTNVALDHHYYQTRLGPEVNTTDAFCKAYEDEVAKIKDFKMDVWFGEWALATDTCGFWLDGVNEATMNPQQKCIRTECPDPIFDLPGFDDSLKIIGPNGTMPDGSVPPDEAYVMSGNCTIDSDQFTNEEVGKIARCALDAFEGQVGVHFFSNFLAEIEPKFNYLRAWNLGWLNQTKVEEDEQCAADDRFKVNPKFSRGSSRRARKQELLQFLS